METLVLEISIKLLCLYLVQQIVKSKDFSRLLSDFPVLFKADLIFKDFSRKPSKFKYFSNLCEPCDNIQSIKTDRLKDQLDSCACKFLVSKLHAG